MAENLDQEDWKEFVGATMQMSFLTTKVAAVTSHPMDVSSRRYDARLKTLAIANGAVPRY